MADDTRSCPSCGARVPPDADRCTLCGTPVAADSTDADPSDPPAENEPAAPSSPDPESAEPTAPDAPPEHVYCNECGHENPNGANYCSRCGSALQALSAAPEGAGAPGEEGARPVSADLPEAPSSPETEGTDAESTSDPQAGMGRQLLWMVGVGLVLVLGFFFATQWSQQYEWGGDGESSAPAAASGGSTQGPTAAQGPESTPDAGPAQSPGGSGAAPSGSPQGPPSGAARGAPPTPDADLSALVDELSGPVEGPVADKIDSLRTRLSGAEGSRARELRAQLVRLYIGAGTPGRAALTQRQLAEATGSVEDRRRAADLLYRWMRQVEQQGDRARIADVATHVATAYRAVVEQRPQDLDARTRMGEAYLLTNSPMRGIRAINQVLEDDSTFVPARFQKGLALLQINRIDQAVAEFEAVKRHAGRQDPFYKQAQRAIDVIRERTSSSGQSGASGAQ